MLVRLVHFHERSFINERLLLFAQSGSSISIVFLVVVVGLVFWVGSCQGKSRHDEYSSYMHSVQSIAQASAATGTTALANQFNSPKLTLPGLQSKLGEWSRQQQQAYDEALRVRPPASLQAAHQEVLATLQLRAIGLAGLANALAAAGIDNVTFTVSEEDQ